MNANSAPWRRLRELEPPLGAKRRVLAELDDALAPEPTRRRRLWLAAPALVAALAIAAWLQFREDETTMSSEGSEVASSDENADKAVAADDRAAADTALADKTSDDNTAPPRIRLAEDDKMSVDLPEAKITVHGPALLNVGADRLEVAFGKVDVVGQAIVAAPICEARISGHAEVAVTIESVHVNVFAGYAEVHPGTAECTVGRAFKRDEATDREPATSGSPPPPETSQPAPDPAAPESLPASHLRRQVEAFRRARSLLGRDERAALAAYRALVAEWPESPLREEADGAIVNALVRLGRLAKARAAARAFLRRHPKSARTAAMRALLEVDE